MFHGSRLLLVLFLSCLTLGIMAEETTRTIQLTLTCPGSGYRYEVDEVRLVDGDIWALTRVQAKGVGTAAITEKKISVKVKAPAKAKVKQFVSGKDWNWGEDNESTIYLKPGGKPPAKFGKATLLFERKATPKEEKKKMKTEEAGTWIFIIKKGEDLDEGDARKLSKEHGATFTKFLGAVGMFFASATEAQARKIEADPRIKLAEKDSTL